MRIGEVQPERIRGLVAANRAIVERNLELMRLRRDLPCDLPWDAMRVGSSDEAGLLRFFERVEFGSMAAALRPPRNPRIIPPGGPPSTPAAGSR
jgi:hypothetical protein